MKSGESWKLKKEDSTRLREHHYIQALEQWVLTIKYYYIHDLNSKPVYYTWNVCAWVCIVWPATIQHFVTNSTVSNEYLKVVYLPYYIV